MAPRRVRRIPRISDKYDGFNDTRPRRLRLLNGITQELIMSDGQSLRDIVDYLGWPWHAVFWVDLGTARAKNPSIYRMQIKPGADEEPAWETIEESEA